MVTTTILDKAIRECRKSFHFDFLSYGAKLLTDDSIQAKIFDVMDSFDEELGVNPFVFLRDKTADDNCTWSCAKTFHPLDPANDSDPLASRMYEILIDYKFTFAGTQFTMRGHYGIVIDYEGERPRLLWCNKAFILIAGSLSEVIQEALSPWDNIDSVLIK